MRGATVAAEEPSTRRKKKAATAVGMRAWLVLDSSGRTQVVEAGKHAIMRRTGLPARDLRILDPLLSYPSTVLGRERAIVINLEHIKAIITAQELLLLNFKDPSVLPFVDQLHTLILRRHQALNSQESGENENANRKNLHDSSKEKEQGAEDDDDEIHGQYGQHAPTPNSVPFEFVALEACLDAACTCLNNEASTLEQEAHPALDKLTSKISTLNLDRVRQIKSRLVAITGRVQKVRDELEHLLDDDGDMAEMYLTEKLEDSSISSIHAQDESDQDIMGGSNSNNDSNTRHIHLIKGLMESNEDDSITSDPPHDTDIDVQLQHSRGDQLFVSRSAISKRFDVQELEMLLEAYFVQIEGTLNKLSALREYVDDTEDYINIMMDDKQNHLLKLGVMVATATMIVSAFVVVVGIFGMNIRIQLFKDTVHGMSRFLWTIGACTAACVFLYVTAIFCWKRKGLLQ